MINARFEFVQMFKDKRVVCAQIETDSLDKDGGPIYYLKAPHTPEEYKQFLEQLDFEYDNGYGLQFLHGTVWFLDGTWATRGEYDGSEWWEIHYRPEIPDYLINKDEIR